MLARLTAVIGLVAAAQLALAGTATATPAPPRNPYVSSGPAATMHTDSESSDTYAGPGPGTGPLLATYVPLLGACSTILIGSDGYPVVICTDIVDRNPTVYLLDPNTALPLASMRLTAGGLLGSIYAYLDNADRLVVTDGTGSLLRIAHTSSSLTVASRTSLTSALGSGDSVVGLAPDWAGRVWFASAAGVIGTVDPVSGAVRSIHLPAGEGVANSISTSPAGTAVVSDHALYELTAAPDGTPQIVWRNGYDRGTVRKPGQLSQGSGATPTFLGPVTGDEDVAIVDNAEPAEHLLVYDVATGGLVCSLGVTAGTENSPIGIGRSVVVATTYGYPYPAVPDGAGPAVPATAPFSGGMTRVDVDGSGCHVVWQNSVRSAAVPKWSVPDGVIYTSMRTGLLNPTMTTNLDTYAEVAIDASTGAVLHSQLIGASTAFDTLQLAAAATTSGVIFQGTLTGVVRMTTTRGG